jgi:hypothetical protein
VLVVAPPIVVSPGADREELARKQDELQMKLEQARELAEKWFTLPEAERERQRALWNA